MSFKGSDEKKELELAPIVNKNNYQYYVVSDSKSECNDESEENLF